MRPLPRAYLLAAAVAGALLLPGCGMDPPPAADSAPVADPAAPVQAGVAPSPGPSLEKAEANGEGTRCNIETLAGQGLEGVHPTVAAGPSVEVLGWYAPLATTSEVADPAANAPAEPAGATATPAPAPAAPSPRGMLVISSENGAEHWTVALPEPTERRDVAAAFNDPAIAQSGFQFALDLRELKPGFYGLHLSDAAHSPGSVCGLGRGFVIK